VSGFDLKFVRELAEHLANRPDLEVTVDEWPGLAERSPATKELVAAAGSILAEWARPSAAWLSEQKQPGQILVVRLHRYELDFPYPRQIDIANVDAVVYVSPPIGRRIQDELGWPADKLVHIPNFLAVARFDRPKLPEARFGLGLVGMEWMNKRLDLALDLLAAVRRQDRRYTLFVRSVMPWENQYAWSQPAERQYVSWCFERIERDPVLRGAVSFDPPGRDMARWYRRVGHLLSMSDIESFHMAAAEGMASGAVPVIRPWPGAAEIYRGEWIHRSVEDAAAAVLANADPDAWQERAASAKAEITRKVDPAAVVCAWADLLHGDLAAARSQFQAGWPEAGR
jgi:glycosyltransferase involved in cell wall biosynthesis